MIYKSYSIDWVRITREHFASTGEFDKSFSRPKQYIFDSLQRYLNSSITHRIDTYDAVTILRLYPNQSKNNTEEHEEKEDENRECSFILVIIGPSWQFPNH